MALRAFPPFLFYKLLPSSSPFTFHRGGYTGVLFFFSPVFVFECRNRTGVTELQAGHACVIATYFLLSLVCVLSGLKLFFSRVTYSLVRRSKRWRNAAELAHGLFFFEPGPREVGKDEKPRRWLLVGV